MRQQDAIRAACMIVLGRVPEKGADAKEAFTPEVREKIADVMMPGYRQEVVPETDKTAWFIKDHRAPEQARRYIVGKGGTDLLENWTKTPESSEKPAKSSVKERIAALRELKDLISDEAYEKKMNEILADI